VGGEEGEKEKKIKRIFVKAGKLAHLANERAGLGRKKEYVYLGLGAERRFEKRRCHIDTAGGRNSTVW